MKLRARKASWFVSGLLLVAAASAGRGLVVAQPEGEAPKAAFEAGDATFEALATNKFVNVSSITYASDEGTVFDIYFACSSSRGTDPLRLTDPEDIRLARSYFNDEKRCGRHFVKASRFHIGVRHIAYVETSNDSVTVYFNSRMTDSLIRVTLSGADARGFREKMPRP